MRRIQIFVPADSRQAVLDTLDEHGVEYGVADETSDNEYDAIVTFSLPTAAVEPVLEDLRAVGIDQRTHTVISEVESVISEAYERLEEEYAETNDEEDDETEDGAGNGTANENGGVLTAEDRIAREELQARAKGLVSSTPTYVVLTLVSAVIATAGLLLDSPATVVGSMVIAPLIGPALSASVGTVLDDRELFDRGVKLQLLGIAVAIASATLFALLVRHLYLVPPGVDVLELGEVSERAAPNFLVLAIALGAGVAGILSLMTGVSTALVGVMIAVALIPPAAAVGVGIAFGITQLALGASVIVAVNVLSINLASLVVLWYEDYRPESWFKTREARSALLRQVLTLVVAIALVSSALVGVTYDSYAAANTEAEIGHAVADELERADERLTLRDLTVERTGVVPPRETDRVAVTVAIDPGTPIPHLVDRLETRVEAVTGVPVDVDVEFVLVQQS